MAETVHIQIPDDDWINVSEPAGHDGFATNSGNNTLIYVNSSVKPDSKSTLGHRVDDDKEFSYNVVHPIDLWVRALHKPGIISITPQGDMSRVIGGRGGITSDALGIQKTSHDLSLFHGLFTFDIPPTMWLILENDVEVQNALSTKVTSVGGRLSVVSGATPGDSSFIISRRHALYQPSRGLKWAGSVGFKGANLDGIIRAGFLVELENGIFFKTKGDGNLYAAILNDGVETHEELINFPFPIDITLGNIYDIQIQWRGVGIARFFAGNPSTGLPELVHEISFLNTLDEEVFVRNPALSGGFHVENVTEEVSVWSGCVDITVEGGGLEREQYGEVSVAKTVSAGGTGGGIVAVRNPHLAPNGKINTRDMRLVRLTVTSSKKATYKVYRTRDPSAVTGGAWAVVSTGSFVEGNSTMTAIDLTKMEEFTTIRAAAALFIEKTNPFAESIDFFGIHGDIMVVVITNGSSVDVDFSVEWGEQT